ncbi:gamma-glutamylcyclotransferase-like [Lycorma delicatula]|uniref:gamma-glutamylcyclotransferase-like n=1 Tax=Lycorma delicatula TaxID=130591 RepID=UPI003F51222F
MAALQTFLYFAYGSNLLAQRIHIANPSAERKTIGKVLNYRLDFNNYSQRWKGAAGTIAPDNNTVVWGAVWELDNKHLESLDNQEGVADNIYRVIQVNVITPEGNEIKCRCYELCDLPPALGKNEKFPESRYPSKAYLDTIIAGAKESKLPDEYIKYIQSFPHNGYDVKVNFTTQFNQLQ